MIVGVADCHLGKSIKESDVEFQEDSFLALERLYQQVITLKASAVIFAGDVVDKSAATGAVSESLIKFIGGLLKKGVKTYFIQGNHDKQTEWHKRKVPLLASFGAISLHKTLTDIDGVSVYGLDCQPFNKLKEELLSVPPCDLLVLHQSSAHLLHVKDAQELFISDIPAHVKNVLVGDIHVFDLTALPSGGVVCSPGCLTACKMNETGKAGSYSLISKNPKGQLNFVQGHIGCRKFLIQKLIAETTDQDLATLCENVLKAVEAVGKNALLPKPVIDLQWTEGVEDKLIKARRVLAASSNDIVIWETKENPSFTGFEMIMEKPVFTKLTLTEALPKIVSDKDVLSLCTLMLNAGIKSTAADSWLKERLSNG